MKYASTYDLCIPMLAQNIESPTPKKTYPNQAPSSTQPHPSPPANQLQTSTLKKRILTDLNWLHTIPPNTWKSRNELHPNPSTHPSPTPSPPSHLRLFQGAFFRKDLQRLTSWSSVKTRPHRPESSAWTRGTYLPWLVGGEWMVGPKIGVEQMECWATLVLPLCVFVFFRPCSNDFLTLIITEIVGHVFFPTWNLDFLNANHGTTEWHLGL